MVETGAKSKIPGMSRKKSGCGGEVVSVVTAAAHLGSAWKTESTGSITVMQGKVHKTRDKVCSSCAQSSHTKDSSEAFFHFLSLF